MSPAAATPFLLLGGAEGVRRLADAFYNVMEREPAFAALRAIHAADLAPMRERLADWLVQWMGGPRLYAEKHPKRGCIVSAHAAFPIDQRLADQWMACMRQAFEAAAVPTEFRAMVDPVMAGMCQGLRNDRAA
jgi:hemoglobin